MAFNTLFLLLGRDRAIASIALKVSKILIRFVHTGNGNFCFGSCRQKCLKEVSLKVVKITPFKCKFHPYTIHIILFPYRKWYLLNSYR